MGRAIINNIIASFTLHIGNSEVLRLIFVTKVKQARARIEVNREALITYQRAESPICKISKFKFRI